MGLEESAMVYLGLQGVQSADPTPDETTAQTTVLTSGATNDIDFAE